LPPRKRQPGFYRAAFFVARLILNISANKAVISEASRAQAKFGVFF
jgi:hypothetical protein